MNAANTIDITALTDAAFDRFMEAAAEGSTDCIDVDDLTPADRRSFAKAYGWDLTPFVLAWIAG